MGIPGLLQHMLCAVKSDDVKIEGPEISCIVFPH